MEMRNVQMEIVINLKAPSRKDNNILPILGDIESKYLSRNLTCILLPSFVIFLKEYKINVYFSESTCMSKKCTQKEFGNLLEYIALGNQCKNVKRMF